MVNYNYSYAYPPPSDGAVVPLPAADGQGLAAPRLAAENAGGGGGQISALLKNLLSGKEVNERGRLDQWKELMSAIGERVEGAAAVSDAAVEIGRLHAPVWNDITAQMTDALQELSQGSKFGDELLAVSALLLQHTVVLRVNQSLNALQAVHKRLCDQQLSSPDDVQLKKQSAKVAIYIKQHEDLLQQAMQQPLLQWSRVLASGAEQSADVLSQLMPALQGAELSADLAAIGLEALTLVYAVQGLRRCHGQDCHLQQRKSELLKRLKGEQDEAVSRFLQMELAVIDHRLAESGVELLRYSTTLSVGLSFAALVALNSAALGGAAVLSPALWPLSVFAGAVAVGALGYQYRHEVGLYSRLAQLYCSHRQELRRYAAAKEGWEEQQSKIEVAMNTSDIITNIALQKANEINELFREQDRLLQLSQQTRNPLKKIFLLGESYLLQWERQVALKEKGERIGRVLENYEDYRRELPAIKSARADSEDAIVAAEQQLTGYRAQKTALRQRYDRAKLGVDDAPAAKPSVDDLRYERRQLKTLRDHLLRKTAGYRQGAPLTAALTAERSFVEGELQAVERQLASLERTLQQAAPAGLDRLEDGARSRYRQQKLCDGGGAAFQRDLQALVSALKGAPYRRAALLEYLVGRLAAQDPSLERGRLREYVASRLAADPLNFLARVAFLQGQYHFYSEALAGLKLVDAVFPAAAKLPKAQKRAQRLVQPPATAYLADPQNRLRLEGFISALLAQQGVQWHHNLNMERQFILETRAQLASGDVDQQEALLRRYHLLDKNNRLKAEIADLLVPPPAYERQLVERLRHGHTAPTGFASDPQIEFAILSLGLTPKEPSGV